MILKVYTVYDSATTAYSKPFFQLTNAEAIRSFSAACLDSSTSFFAHPSYFTLFAIGEFNDSTAKLISYDTPVSLGTALEYKSKEVSNASSVDTVVSNGVGSL